MTNLPKIEKCVCGRKAVVIPRMEGMYARCVARGCWDGPYRKTKRGAINAWNRVKRAVRNPDGLTEAYMAGHYDGRNAKVAAEKNSADERPE